MELQEAGRGVLRRYGGLLMELTLVRGPRSEGRTGESVAGLQQNSAACLIVLRLL